MKNFNILLIHELKRQSKSFIFILMVTLSLLMSFICGFIQVNDFAGRQAAYQEEMRIGQEQQKEMFVWSQFAIPVLFAPNPMSIFYRGLDESIGNKSIISPVRLPYFETTSQRQNPFLSIFANLDISGVVKLLSIFVLLLAAGLISGEREESTYNLIFANSIRGSDYFLSKFCATAISTLLALVILFFATGILIIANPMIQITAGYLGRMVLVFLASFFYLSVFIVLGLAVSACLQSTGTSVLWGVLIWICISFIYPNLVSTVVSKPLDAYNRIVNLEIENIEENSYKKYFATLTGKKWGGLSSMHVPIYGEFDQNIQEQRLLVRSNMDALLGMSEKAVLASELANWETMWPILWKYQQDIQDQKDIIRQKQIKQQENNLVFTCFLPDVLYDQTMAVFSNTGVDYRDEYLQSELRRFRSQIFDYLDSKNAFSEKFFTQFPKEQWQDNWDSYTTEEKNIYGNSRERENYPRLQMADIPVFTFEEKFNFPKSLLMLLIVNAILLITGLTIFRKSQVK